MFQSYEAIQVAERERDFYFQKLRQIEDLCNALPEGQHLNAESVLAILYTEVSLVLLYLPIRRFRMSPKAKTVSKMLLLLKSRSPQLLPLLTTPRPFRFLSLTLAYPLHFTS